MSEYNPRTRARVHRAMATRFRNKAEICRDEKRLADMTDAEILEQCELATFYDSRVAHHEAFAAYHAAKIN